MTKLLLFLGSALTALAVLCGATPFLPWVLHAAGLGRWTEVLYQDWVILPMLPAGMLLLAVALCAERPEAES